MTAVRRVFVACALLVGACGGQSGVDALTVSAAASLSEVFAELAADFESAHPEVNVRLNFAGSSTLRDQILEGAPVDVFASASEDTMEEVAASSAALAAPVVFARNRLTIAVPVGNPAGVAGLGAFENDDLLLGVCEDEVPCGALARQVFTNAGIDPSIDTKEPDVRALLTKIEVGELDAGLVYVTDVISADVASVEVPPGVNVDTDYPIVALRDGESPDLAELFVAFVTSPEGEAVLRSYGFGAP